MLGKERKDELESEKITHFVLICRNFYFFFLSSVIKIELDVHSLKASATKMYDLKKQSPTFLVWQSGMEWVG